MNISQPALTKKKFLSLSQPLQHKHAARTLRIYYETHEQIAWEVYQQYAKYLALPPLTNNFEAVADRYYDHIAAAGTSLKEPAFLIKQRDTFSEIPFLPIGIYLENLRSAHNVGSILRTVEAFRLGTVYFSEKTPSANHTKVQITAMGCAPHVPTKTIHDLSSLPKPLIAVETAPDAPSYNEWTFPPSFSLLIGNEAYGLKKETLCLADQVIHIPLQGSKNSLNVSCAFAIIAAEIRRQHHNQ